MKKLFQIDIEYNSKIESRYHSGNTDSCLNIIQDILEEFIKSAFPIQISAISLDSGGIIGVGDTFRRNLVCSSCVKTDSCHRTKELRVIS